MPSDRAKFEIELKTTADTDAEQNAASLAAAKTAGEAVAPPRNEPGFSLPELKLPEFPDLVLDPRRPVPDSPPQDQPPATAEPVPSMAAAPKPIAGQTPPEAEPQPVNHNSTPADAPAPGAAVALARQVLDQARAAQDNLARQRESHQDLQDLMAQILGVIDQIVQHPAIQGASEIRRRLATVEAQLKNSRTLNR